MPIWIQGLTAIAAICQIVITLILIAKFTKYKLLVKENKILGDLLFSNTLNLENYENVKTAIEDAKKHVTELRKERGDLPNF